jgi:hypothetical protein
MSDKETTGTPARRGAAVLLGTLAASAVLGAALGAHTGTEKDTSISDQFRAAFTPGTLQVPVIHPQIVVSDG